jgi:hypothetical protein
LVCVHPCDTPLFEPTVFKESAMSTTDPPSAPPPPREPPPEAHDVLLIPKLVQPGEKLPDGRSKMLQMSVKEDGSYDASRWLEPQDKGARKVYNVARQASAADPPRGPGFAILPIRPDPGSQYNTCYLINTENLFMPNPWTAADWDAFDLDDDDGEPTDATSAAVAANPDWRESGFEILVAGARGQVFHVKADGKPNGVASINEVALEAEPEIWGQLREGVIVGTVFYEKEQRVLPLVNAVSLNVPKGGE